MALLLENKGEVEVLTNRDNKPLIAALSCKEREIRIQGKQNQQRLSR